MSDSTPGAAAPTTTAATATAHYGANYFDWQKEVGAFGGWANSRKFAATVRPSDTVIDFGCGGGFLLHNLNCRRRIGIEPNAAAAPTLAKLGVERFASPAAALESLGAEVADVVLSNNALEHTLNPFQEIVALRPLLKRGGRLHFVVPCDSFRQRHRRDDIHRHLYSWSPQNLGNLLEEAGFEVEFAAPYLHKWPPYYRTIARLGWPAFDLACRVYARLERSWFQVEVRARRAVE